MKRALEKKFPNKVYAIGTDNTDMASISVQAEELYQKINKDPVLRGKKIILIGRSQGGLRGYELIRKHGNDLNIVSLTTIGTPWQGAPVLNAYGLVEKIASKLEEKIPAIEKLREYVQENNPSKPGIADLLPKSKFLRDTRKSLRRNKIPIYTIAGHISICAATPNKLQNVCRVVLFPLEAIIDPRFSAHDLIVPVNSQVAARYRRKTNFQYQILGPAIHLLVDGLSNIAELNKEEIIQSVIYWIE